ncbi:hypothetical protein EU527_10550 [Candidatus Thorarchaeota archaeon]|nr:MAG: hypothetical protein EU527_10550 [Candidatus Thorarchaeota archaeon]
MRGLSLLIGWVVTFIFVYFVYVFGSGAVADAIHGGGNEVINSMLRDPNTILFSIVFASIFFPFCYCCAKATE